MPDTQKGKHDLPNHVPYHVLSRLSGTHTQFLWWLAKYYFSCMPTPLRSRTNRDKNYIVDGRAYKRLVNSIVQILKLVFGKKPLGKLMLASILKKLNTTGSAFF